MSKFRGFELPKENWSKLPHSIIDALPEFTSLAELKVVLYVLRHTWGFQEFDKARRLSIDEIANGRKGINGERFDEGTGMSDNAVKDGIARAVEHGFLIVETNDDDLARIKKTYRLNMASEGQELMPEGQKLTPQPSKVDPRTKKESKRKKVERSATFSPNLIAVKQHPLYQAYYRAMFPPQPVTKLNAADYIAAIEVLTKVGITAAQVKVYAGSLDKPIPFNFLADRVTAIARASNAQGKSAAEQEWDKAYGRLNFLDAEVES